MRRYQGRVGCSAAAIRLDFAIGVATIPGDGITVIAAFCGTLLAVAAIGGDDATLSQSGASIPVLNGTEPATAVAARGISVIASFAGVNGRVATKKYSPIRNAGTASRATVPTDVGIEAIAAIGDIART
jgi:hypothetical protein